MAMDSVGYNDFDFLKEKNKSDPVMGAKLNFKTHLQNTFFFFVRYLSRDPTHSTVQKLWYSIYYSSFTARCVFHVKLY